MFLFWRRPASGQWKTFLLWRTARSFSHEDAYFHKDIGFFVFDLPWFRFVVSFAFTTLVIALIVAAATHYLYGGIRLGAKRDSCSSHGAGAAVGAARPLHARQGGRLLAGPLRPHHRPGPPVHRINTPTDHAVLPAKTILISSR